MKKKQKNTSKKNNVTLKRVIVFISIILLVLILWKLTDKPTTVTNQQKIEKTVMYKAYISKDLQISFNYPTNWYINEKDRSIMLTSYKSTIGENSRPDKNQIKMFIDEYGGGCHQIIEENLKDPACGEGGPSSPLNKIVSKDVAEKTGGTFYKYVIEYPNEQQGIFYLLQKKGSDKILQISKEPDSSQYEKEFEEIVGSITFL